MFNPMNPSGFFDPHAAPVFISSFVNPFEGNKKPQTQVVEAPKKHTQDPMVTGSSVLGVRFKDGVMIASDTLASYGSLARFREIERVQAVGKNTIIGATGEYSDFQYITKLLDELLTDYNVVDDGSSLSPKSIHSYLTRVLYGRRNKFDPLWNQIVVGGYRDGKAFLGYADLHGTSYEDDTVATGYGNYIAKPLLRKHHNPEMSKDQAKQLLEMCMRVLYYRDARTINRIQIATITADGPSISEPYELAEDWSVGDIKYKLPDVRMGQYQSSDNNNNNGRAILK